MQTKPDDNPLPMPADTAPQHGGKDDDYWPGRDDEGFDYFERKTVDAIRARGEEVTREAFINEWWHGAPPIHAWTNEHEDDVPEALRNYDHVNADVGDAVEDEDEEPEGVGPEDPTARPEDE